MFGGSHESLERIYKMSFSELNRCTIIFGHAKTRQNMVVMARWECELPSLRQIFDDINLLIKCLSVNYSASKRNSILRRRTRHSKCHPQQRLSCVGVIRKSPLQSAFRLKLLGLGRILSVKSIEYHGILKLIRFCSKQ